MIFGSSEKSESTRDFKKFFDIKLAFKYLIENKTISRTFILGHIFLWNSSHRPEEYFYNSTTRTFTSIKILQIVMKIYYPILFYRCTSEYKNMFIGVLRTKYNYCLL